MKEKQIAIERMITNNRKTESEMRKLKGTRENERK